MTYDTKTLATAVAQIHKAAISDYSDVPIETLTQLLLWDWKTEMPTGDIVYMLRDDFSYAMRYATTENIPHMRAIAMYIYNQLSAGCWGSLERMRAWKGLSDEDIMRKIDAAVSVPTILKHYNHKCHNRH